MKREEALGEARRIIAEVRERGFKHGGAGFTDAQIWQALLDTQGWEARTWDRAAAKLMEHIIEGRTPPTCEYMALALENG